MLLGIIIRYFEYIEVKNYWQQNTRVVLTSFNTVTKILPSKLDKGPDVDIMQKIQICCKGCSYSDQKPTRNISPW